MEDLHRQRLRINFIWLLRLRWAAVAGQLMTVLAVRFAIGIPVPTLVPLLWIIGAAATTNGVITMVFIRHQTSRKTIENGDALQGSILVIDVLLLSALLYTAGGPTNPFTIFYLVNLGLAAVILRARWAWPLTGLAFLCYGLLYLDHVALPALGRASELGSVLPIGDIAELPPAALRLATTYIAFAAAALIIVYFITRLTHELDRREMQLSHARQRKARSDRLESLATLAAGAAHELASPLSTIAVVARELERHLERESAGHDAVEDARLIRAEVSRCRTILDQMSTDAGENVGEHIASVRVADLLSETANGLGDPHRIDIRRDDSTGSFRVLIPPRTVAQSLRAIIKNGLDASSADGIVVVRAFREEDSLIIEVSDQGTGMDTETLTRAEEPFFTTKEPGHGMGLGLFLTRTVLERLGGSLILTSSPGKGTLARVTVPGSPDQTTEGT